MPIARSTVMARVICLESIDRDGTGVRREFQQVRALVADRHISPALTRRPVAELDCPVAFTVT
jgi:hypothetical protein